jgi:DNA-binding CsgD family transcriptional regulator/tetratricopeptide (TPR) repeat protein
VTSPVLRVLVATEHPLPVDLLSALEFADDDLPVVLSQLELDGLIDWNDDGTVTATDEATATVRLTGADRARHRGLVGRAARSSALPPHLVAEWLLDGCRVAPDPTVVPWLLNRADHLMRGGDLDESSLVLAAVVAAVERGQAIAPIDRVRASLRLGYVLRWLGRHEEATRLGERALAIARESDEPAALATAALAWRPDALAISDDPTVVALVDDALAGIGPEEPAMRSRLLAARAEALLFSDLAAARAASTEALDLGRRSHDAEAFLRAGYAYRVAHWHPSRQDEMLRLGTELVAASTRAADFAEFGTLIRLQVFLERGDWGHLDGELAAMRRRLRSAPRPFELLWCQVLMAARAQTKGNWAEADALIDSCLATASGPEYGTAFQLLSGQQVLGAWHRGDDLVPLVGADVIPAGPMRTSWEACLLGWTCDRRPAAEVTEELDRFLACGVAALRDDLTFGPVTSSLAMAAAEVGARDHAAALYEALLPFADQWAGTGGAVVTGPYALHLGRLAATLGRPEDATALLDRALHGTVAGGCTPWEARVCLALAEAEEEPSWRRSWADRALRLADGAGMVAVAARARGLLGRPQRPADLTEREQEALRLVAEGATNAEIAERLCLSVKTIERHLVNAYRKAGVKNRAEAAAFVLGNLAPR